MPQYISTISSTSNLSNSKSEITYATPPESFPFDSYEAYRIRIINFMNGAIYALHYSPLTDKQRASKENAIHELARIKLKDLEAFKEQTQGQPITFGAELYRLIHEELPKASGLKPKQIALAEAFYVWQNITPPTRTTQYTQGQLTIVQRDTPRFSPLTTLQKKELCRIHRNIYQPKWFENLDPWAQASLRDIVPKTVDGNWAPYQRYRPSTLRHIPGEANSTVHELKVTSNLDDREEEIFNTKVIRQSVPTSLNMKDSLERQNSATQNLKQMLDEQLDIAETHFGIKWDILPPSPKQGISPDIQIPVLLGGLVTPSEQAGFIVKFIDSFNLSGDENGTKLAHEKEKALQNYPKKNKFKFFNLNVAINAKLSTVVAPNQDFIAFTSKLCGRLSQQVKGKTAEIAQIQNVNTHIKTLAGQKIEGRNRNLYLAAYYDLATRLMGGLSTGNCKSSKDRKGTELIMADAMLVYYADELAQGKTPCFPSYSDKGEDRARFVDIVCQVYATGHQLLVAHDNSPGSPGIKDEGFLDQDIIEKLQKMGIFAKSIQLANLNKPGTFWKKFSGRIKTPAFIIAGGAGLATIIFALIASSVLSPLGLLAVGLAFKLTIGTTVTATTIIAACIAQDGIELYRDSRNTFNAQIKRINKMTATKSSLEESKPRSPSPSSSRPSSTASMPFPHSTSSDSNDSDSEATNKLTQTQYDSDSSSDSSDSENEVDYKPSRCCLM